MSVGKCQSYTFVFPYSPQLSTACLDTMPLAFKNMTKVCPPLCQRSASDPQDIWKPDLNTHRHCELADWRTMSQACIAAQSLQAPSIWVYVASKAVASYATAESAELHIVVMSDGYACCTHIRRCFHDHNYDNNAKRPLLGHCKHCCQGHGKAGNHLGLSPHYSP